MFELMTWQNWAIIYAIIGVAVFLSVSLPHHLATRKAEPELDFGSPSSFAEAFGLNPTGWLGIFVDSVVCPLFLIMLICSVWPWLLWLEIVAKWFTDSIFLDPAIEEKEFSVTLDDLREHLSFEKIEAAAFITDPLGAVPDLPFGHLHRVWEQLKETAVLGDEVWSFSAPWVRWRRKYLCSGYVIVHGGEIGAFWITDDKPFDADCDAKPDKQGLTGYLGGGSRGRTDGPAGFSSSNSSTTTTASPSITCP